MKPILTRYRMWVYALLVFVPAYYLIAYFNELRLEPGQSSAMWVRSQNGNDISALLNIVSAGDSDAKLKYSAEKYAEIGIIEFPDVDTIFPPILDGMKIRDMKTAKIADGLTIVDHNKTSTANGFIKYWDVVSKEDDNEVRLAVFSYDEKAEKYQIIRQSRPHIAQRGINTFFEQAPLEIRQNDILGLMVKKPISSNRILSNEMARVLTLSGHRSAFNETEATWDSGNGSFSYSALLEVGTEQGEISGPSFDNAIVRLPQNPVYGTLARYKFIFTSETGVTRLRPNLASLLLNADPYIGLIQEATSPWSPEAFSLALFVALAIVLGLVVRLILPRTQDNYRQAVAIAAILVIFGLARYLAAEFPAFQFVAIVVSFLLVFLLPGIIISGYHPGYRGEATSGRIVLAFVLSLVWWLVPAFGLFLVKTSYWPVISAAILLFGLAIIKPPAEQQSEALLDELSPYWKTFRFAIWGFAAVVAVQTLFSSRFHAESFDTFHHLSLVAKNFALPVFGDQHTNLHDMSMSSMAPYAYNYWGMLVGMVAKISGFDIGTIYCVGSGLLVLLMFIAQWWLIGLLVTSEKQRIAAFGIILTIYLIRSLGAFAPLFQRSEFDFIMFGPSVNEFFLYAVYIVLGIRAIRPGQSAELLIYCGLSMATAFFHMEFILFNCIVLSILIALSLRANCNYRFDRTQVYLLATICWLIVAGSLIKSHVAVGKIVDADSSYHLRFYALRYAEFGVLEKFHYLFIDLLKFINSNMWNAIAVWGGVLLLIFRRRSEFARLFGAAYLVVLLLLLISFNPLAEMILTPLLTSWPLQRIPGYVRSLTFSFAAVSLSIIGAYIINVIRQKSKTLHVALCALLAVIPFLALSVADQWMPQIGSAVYAITYNRSNYLDIAAVANLPEFKYLDEYSKTRHVVVLAEKSYAYAIPSLSHAYSYYHNHYPQYSTHSEEREPVWAACLNAEKECRSQLPPSSLLFVRNENLRKFHSLGYPELFRGRLFTVLRV